MPDLEMPPPFDVEAAAETDRGTINFHAQYPLGPTVRGWKPRTVGIGVLAEVIDALTREVFRLREEVFSLSLRVPPQPDVQP